MIYVVKNDVDVKYVEKLVSEYKEKFGVNIYSNHHIDHFISWLHNEIMVENFNLNRESDDCMYKCGEKPCSRFNEEEYNHLIWCVSVAFDKVGGISTPENLTQFIHSLESMMSINYDEKFRELMHEIVEELLCETITDLDSRYSIRELCNTIQDRIESHVEM